LAHIRQRAVEERSNLFGRDSQHRAALAGIDQNFFKAQHAFLHYHRQPLSGSERADAAHPVAGDALGRPGISHRSAFNTPEPGQPFHG